MKVFVVLAVAFGVASSAPTDILPFNPTFTTGGAIGLPLGGIPAKRHFRAVGEHHEDAHQAEHARSYYDGAASAAAAAALAAAGASASAAAHAIPVAPTVGIFPNAKIGGCAVPLLLSCSPSVHSGHIAHTGYAGYAAPAPIAAPIALAAPAYRTDAEHSPKMREMAPEKNWPQSEQVAKMREMPEQQWAEAERSSQMSAQKQWAEAARAVDQPAHNKKPMQLQHADLHAPAHA